jgi:hypothetical protein
MSNKKIKDGTGWFEDEMFSMNAKIPGMIGDYGAVAFREVRQ